MSATASGVSSATNSPRLRCETSSPSCVSRCIASRSGPRLTPSERASAASPNWSPGPTVPSEIARRSARAMIAGVDSCTTGSIPAR